MLYWPTFCLFLLFKIPFYTSFSLSDQPKITTQNKKKRGKTKARNDVTAVTFTSLMEWSEFEGFWRTSNERVACWHPADIFLRPSWPLKTARSCVCVCVMRRVCTWFSRGRQGAVRRAAASCKHKAAPSARLENFQCQQHTHTRTCTWNWVCVCVHERERERESVYMWKQGCNE